MNGLPTPWLLSLPAVVEEVEEAVGEVEVEVEVPVVQASRCQPRYTGI